MIKNTYQCINIHKMFFTYSEECFMMGNSRKNDYIEMEIS